MRWFDSDTLKGDEEVLKGKREALHGDKEEFNPLDPSLLEITASPTEPPGAVDPIGDIIIAHILRSKGSTQLS